MSFEADFNNNIREEFKASINYPMLVARQPQEKIVVLDWTHSLQKIKDINGRAWTGTLSEPTLGHHGQGAVRATMTSDKGSALVNITVLAGDWKTRLDYVIWQESLTNRVAINLKLLPGYDDLYLIPKDSPHVAFTSFLYGHYHVDIRQWDCGDIDALAKAIHRLMQEHTQPGLAKPSSSFKLVADKERYAVGEKIAIHVEGVAQNWSSQWIFTLPKELLGDAVEYQERRENVFVLNAVKKGTIPVTFTSMNKHTLQLDSQTIELMIE